MRRRRAPSFAAAVSLAIVSTPALAVRDLSFDYTSFEATFKQSQFDVLNYPSINGQYMMTSTDNHRPEMVANNNELAEFYNWLTDRYTSQTTKDGAAAADVINQYTVTNSTKNGPRPTWLILNEISPSLWSANAGPPSNSTYRTWLMDCVSRLTSHYGYKVITLAPFQNPAQNNESWQALSAITDNYIGVECYLSGTEVWNSGSDNTARFNWAKGQYQTSKNSYLARGVPANKIFVTEHFANNTATQPNGSATGWGRAGLASADAWDQVIMIRQDAIKAVGFDGFLAYNWGGNAMGVTEAEQIQHEYYYRSRLVLASQQPQWLANAAVTINGLSIPLTWNHPLNWKGDVPNNIGAVANFFRTNTAARTITLDGGKTVGTLSFNSPNSYTISPGTGGSLTLHNGISPANLSVAQGAHTIGVPLVISNSAAINLTTGSLTLSNGFNSAAAGNITRTGAGTLTITGTQSHAPGQTFIANAGTTNFNSDINDNLTLTINAATVNFNVAQNIEALNLNTGANVKLAPGKRLVNASSIIGNGGKLDLTDGALIARNANIGSLSGTTYTGIQGLIQSARNGGPPNMLWTGPGITTSSPAAQGAAPLTTLATALASEALGIAPSQTTTWRSQSITGDAVLIAYTYTGDANLSGSIDADDYFQIDSSYNDPPGSATYFKGDFNYDGIINADDYFLIDANYHAQGGPMTAPATLGPTTLPEPTAAALLAFAALRALPCRRPRIRNTGCQPVRQAPTPDRIGDTPTTIA